MHFLSLPSLLVGLAVSSVVQAVPSTYGQRTDLMPRGLPDSAYRLRYMPRAMAGFGKKASKRNNKDEDITVIDVTEKIDIDKEEIDLEVKVTQILIKNKGNNKKKDDKRSSDAKKKNKKKDTVIQVVQVVVDIREKDNHKTRYAIHAVTADNAAAETTTMMVTDAQTMTISNQTLCDNSDGTAVDLATGTAAGTGNVVLADATATATAALAAATDDATAPFLQSNQTVLCAPDTPAPAPPAGAMVMADPAMSLAMAMAAADGNATSCV